MKTLPILLIVAACGTTARTDEATLRPPLELEGLPRYHRWSKKIVQGAQPEGDAAFANLAATGVTTVLSVDGAIPDLEGATRHGLRYVHIPIGYDGVPRAAAARIVKAVEQSKGAVYIHCHHGRHRGPAAVMAARISLEGLSNAQAVLDMKISGTSPKYEGLYGDIASFKPIVAAELAKVPADLPSKVLPDGLRAMMVEVSHRYENLKLAKAAAWKVPDGHPDIAPPHESRMLWEHYRETARLDDAKKLGERFLTLLAEGERVAVELEEQLRAGDPDAANRTYRTLNANCNACHAEFRN